MWTPTPMCRVSIALLREDAVAAGLALARFGQFAPLQAPPASKRLNESPGKDYVLHFESARTRIQKIIEFLGINVSADAKQCTRAPTLKQLQTLDTWAGELWRQCSDCADAMRHYQEQLREVHQLQNSLRHYRSLNLDLQLLKHDFRFLQLEIGTIPPQHLPRLRDALAMTGHTLTPFSNHQGRLHVIVAGLKEHAQSLQSVLKAADFRSLQLPQSFIGHPRQVAKRLDEEKRRILQKQRHLQQEIAQKRSQYDHALQRAVMDLLAASGFAQCRPAIHGKGGLAYIRGWVPQHRTQQLHHVLDEQLKGPVFIETHPPTPNEHRQVPSHIQHGPWLRPFTALIETYGIPRYREFDPSLFFALSFIMMFGMMFGDVGQGALIALSSLVLPQRYRPLRWALVSAGLISMCFGMLYGSVFGYEDWIPALWMSPLHDPERMLAIAFFWGVGFIVLATLIKIRNLVVEQQYAEAWLGPRGGAGLVLYLGLLGAAAQWLNEQTVSNFWQAAILLPLAVISWHQWRKQTLPVAERALVVTIEGFETLMSYVSNTLSFMRVAAFALNHVALAVAIFTLANRLDETGHWLTIVLGNAFILLLEGAIVVIQVLRLEYYEGFSRFFYGDGHAFQPIQLSLDKILNPV